MRSEVEKCSIMVTKGKGDCMVINTDWSRKELSPQRLGSFGEYYAKMTIASYGLSIYTSEVDDHGIDFVAETKNGFIKFQVKTVRQSTNYVFMREQYFNIADNTLFLFLSILKDGELPISYIIPATVWGNDSTGMFVYRKYEGKKSAPEYGINLSAKNMPLLDVYKVGRMIDKFYE